jgi:hypothetical protein
VPPGKGMRRVYTVETDPKGGWCGEAKGSTRAVAKDDNKAEVVKRTIEVAKKQPKAQVRIKGAERPNPGGTHLPSEQRP